MKRLAYPVPLALACFGTAHAAEPPPLPTPWFQLQVWGTLYDMDEDPQADPAGYGDPEADPGVSIRRGRIGLQGRYALVDYQLAVGMGTPFDVYTAPEPMIGIVDASAGFNFDPGDHRLRLSAGVEKVPVSREFLISARDLLFQERAILTDALTPNRGVGLGLDWQAPFGLRVRTGVYNGTPDVLGDGDFGKMIVGRVEWAQGDTYTTFTHTRDDAWGVGLSGLYDDSLATRTVRAGADALVRFGPIAAMAEGAYSQISPTDTTTAPPDVEAVTNRWSAMVQVSGYVPVMGGGVEIGARGEIFDDALSRRDNGDVAIVYAGATWRDPVPGVDFGLGYVRRQELAGSSHPNDTVRMWLQVSYPTWRGRRAPIESAPPETYQKPAAPEPLDKPTTPEPEALDKPTPPAPEALDEPTTPEPLEKPTTPEPAAAPQ